ncbi:hypothetical protein T8T21_03820 [Limimaricola variabilis]|uniref:hypothetical protein n=1 Tax=Limimaricola variabilis TaxID=1492771 RepID=UPI002AC925A0|nr:hypothetical protein [Limimaricola variabilis]WPY95263.1 hypothetical protein T8T21_03820 [Limimaricola variabilis]
MTDQINPIDRDWFDAHPERNFRIRRMIPGEFFPDPDDLPVPKKGQSLADAVMRSAALFADAKLNFPVAPRGKAHFTLVQKLREGVRAKSHLILSDQLKPEAVSDDTAEAIALLHGKIWRW